MILILQRFCISLKGKESSTKPQSKRFPVNSTRNNGQLQTSLVTIGKPVMMHTALAEVSGPSGETAERVRLLLDCSSQILYISHIFGKKTEV